MPSKIAQERRSPASQYRKKNSGAAARRLKGQFLKQMPKAS
jgi:hypothetical protein